MGLLSKSKDSAVGSLSTTIKSLPWKSCSSPFTHVIRNWLAPFARLHGFDTETPSCAFYREPLDLVLAVTVDGSLREFRYDGGSSLGGIVVQVEHSSRVALSWPMTVSSLCEP